MLSKIDAQLTVVTVNYYAEELLERCIDSLAASSEGVELIVVDNGSDDDQRGRLCARHPAMIWLRLPNNVGFGAACNIGAKKASSERILFLNPDTWIVEKTITRLLDALSGDYGNCIVGCAVLNLDGSVQASCRRFPGWTTAVCSSNSLLARLLPMNRFTRSYLMADFDHLTPQEVDWVSGAAIAMRLETFRRLLGFDESFFMYCEDVDLCKRAAAQGIKTFFHPLVMVMHQIGGSSNGHPVRALQYRHVSLWRYYLRHLRIWALDPAVLLFLACRFGVSALTVLFRTARRTVLGA